MAKLTDNGETNMEATDMNGDEDSIETADPASFPPTPEGLAAFLSSVDGPCSTPSNSANSNERDTSPNAMTYRATSVKIEAAASREIPVPVQGEPGTRIVWEVSVEERDVNFGVEIQLNDTDDISTIQEFIQIHPQSEDDKDTPSSCSTSGQYEMESKSDATIFLSFDNTYSWITPKHISYIVTVTPPIDEKQIMRSKRAEKSLQSIANTLLPMAEVVATQGAEKRKQAAIILEEGEQELKTMESAVEAKQNDIEASEEEAKKIEALMTEGKQALKALKLKFDEEEQQLKKLLKTMQDLELERKFREGELKTLKTETKAREEDLKQREAEVAQKRQDAKTKEEVLIQTAEEKEQKRGEVSKRLQARDAALAEEESSMERVKFLKSQAEELKLRVL